MLKYIVRIYLYLISPQFKMFNHGIPTKIGSKIESNWLSGWEGDMVKGRVTSVCEGAQRIIEVTVTENVVSSHLHKIFQTEDYNVWTPEKQALTC